MDSLRDWEQFYRETNGLKELTARPKPAVTHFGTTSAYTQELDARGREDATMQGVRNQVEQVTAFYNQLDHDIAECEQPLTATRLMRLAEVVEEELNDRMRRYLRRGSGSVEVRDSITRVQSQRTDR